MSSNAEIRAAARDALRGQWGMAVLVAFVYMAITAVIGSIPVVKNIGPLLLGGPLAFGLYAYFLHVVRGNRPELGVMFSGFQRFVPTLVLYLLQAIFVFLWMLLLIVPGIIAALRYSMSYFILLENPGLSPLDAINRSKEMMQGHKMQLFLLQLSFIGWALLCVLTLGIGLLWLMPYMQTSMAAFYERLKSA
ncbi:DUF975 family protein [Paenibacillus antri]|uniref:DUF975 family protein n=1 Tax=Paenibacillus antri TaxID=2582848 RepID=A0A5R9G8P4_9BACL|nr:DUF975 family protein [Paenibacillus antri]TLS49434.1 DUF975 family protein [Paenibacillus antri]